MKRRVKTVKNVDRPNDLFVGGPAAEIGKITGRPDFTGLRGDLSA
jgi:hypothetical protein